MPVPRTPMLWIALHCPTLPLDRIQRRLPEGLVPPLAVTNAVQGARRSILMVNAPARAGGVLPGQTVASALALQPQLMLIERDHADEDAALYSAALAALRFTPNVVQKPAGLLLEVSASLRLFGGRDALLRQLLQTVRQAAGLSVCVDWAGTAAAAWMLARHALADTLPETPPECFDSRLDALPVTLLEQAVPHADVLAGIGCRTVADLRRLPRAGVARRFGPDLLGEIDRACGEQPDPQRWLSPAEHFEERLELLARVENAEALLFAAQRLMLPLSGWLCARHAALGALTLVLHHETGRRHGLAPTELTIHVAEPVADVAHLTGLLRERLTRLPLQASVEEISLRVDDVVTQSAPNQELFATAQSEATTINRLIEKLVARLGTDAVQRLQALPDHRPERAYTWCAPEQARRGGPAGRTKGKDANKHAGKVVSKGAGSAGKQAGRIADAVRPVWLMPAPLPLEVRANKPVHGSPLRMLAGPERIEAGWWDDALATRDYFIAENAAGQMLWVYRERQVLQQGPVWYLQGLFG